MDFISKSLLKKKSPMLVKLNSLYAGNFRFCNIYLFFIVGYSNNIKQSSYKYRITNANVS